MEFIEKRRKFFVAKRAEAKRNKPPTKAQQRRLMCTYLNNMDGWKTRVLKNKSFVDIQDLFNKEMKRVNMFVDLDTEVVESTKKDKAETLQESSSKRAGDDGDEVTIDATPVSTKSPTIVDYKIYKERRKSFYRFLEQMLQVDVECEMAYELLRLVKKELKEGYRANSSVWKHPPGD
uniref:Uncharacterized protein n=1 Tax=Tanacetum cinerariifolium TaxID=118510 RepID=A0A6L2J0A0_TANCI|nr:hypothetical protein [Tanacetum cinerariifolium]